MAFKEFTNTASKANIDKYTYCKPRLKVTVIGVRLKETGAAGPNRTHETLKKDLRIKLMIENQAEIKKEGKQPFLFTR